MRKGHLIDKELLMAYYDGQLDESEKKRAEEHLNSCKECRAYVLQLEKLDKTVTAEESRNGQDMYFESFVARVAGGIARMKADREKKHGWSIFRWVGIPLVATATMAIAVVVSLSLLSREDKPGRISTGLNEYSSKDRDKHSPMAGLSRKTAVMSPAVTVEEKPSELPPHYINEVTAIVIYLPDDDRPIPPPGISRAIEIDLSNGS